MLRGPSGDTGLPSAETPGHQGAPAQNGLGQGGPGLGGTGGSLCPETGRETSSSSQDECGKACTLARLNGQAAGLEAGARAAKRGSAWPGPAVFLRCLSADWCDLSKPGGSGKQNPAVNGGTAGRVA